VEDLQQPDGALHPVQQAMVECHGSQCGFCTPGFVMSLWGMYLQKNGETPTRGEIDDTLSGNLCRCTGYRPIIDAAKRMGELPQVTFDRDALAQQLLTLQRGSASTYEHGGQHFHAPCSIDELVALRAAKPQACLLAGSTDVGLWVTKQLRDLGDIIYLGNVAALKTIAIVDGKLQIGAGASLNDAYAGAVRALSARVVGTVAALCFLADPQCRHPGRQCGQWFAHRRLDAVADCAGQRDRAARNCRPAHTCRWKISIKVTKRKICGPVNSSKPCACPCPVPTCIFARINWPNVLTRISRPCAPRLPSSSTASASLMRASPLAAWRPRRSVPRKQKLPAGTAWTEDNLVIAMRLLSDDYAPLSDMRASNTYRMTTAQNLLRRFWLETRPGAPLLRTAVNAYACRA